MDELKLKAIVKSEISSAVGYLGSDLSSDRSDAIERYLGEPYGDELPDRSSVVSKDLQEVVEWIMPSLMRTFSRNELVVFDPVGPEDEQAAEQETDVINYLFWKKNRGWFIFYTWFKDALIEKNGVIKAYWSEEDKQTRETYEGLTDDQFALLSSDSQLELIEHTETVYHQMQDGSLMEGEMAGMPSIVLHDAAFIRTVTKGDSAILNIPPADFGLSKGHNSLFLHDADFCYHRMEKTVSELNEAGYDTDQLVKGLQADTEEEYSRNLNVDELDEDESLDPAMRKVEVYECYIRVDYDEDGIAELRKITYSHNTILDNEEVDRIPFIGITPYVMTHKFWGLSVNDRIGDLAKIKTAIWRNALDNMYLANNQRVAANERVNLDDLLSTRPMQIIQIEGKEDIGGSLMPIAPADIVSNAFSMLEYTDKLREGRTGVSQQADLVEDLLANNKGDLSVARVMSAAEQQVELIARIFAEVGIKELWLLLHELNRKHQDIDLTVKLRGQWSTVNPAQWRERSDMTIKVGLGTEDKYKQIAGIQQIIQAQKEMLQFGMQGVLVSDFNIYNAHKDLANFAELNADKYFMNPSSPQAMQTKQQRAMAAQNQPNPLAEVEQIKGQFKLQSDQMRIQFEGQMAQLKAGYEREIEMIKMQMANATDKQKLEAELINKAAERASKEAIEVAKLEVEAYLQNKEIDLGAPGIGAGLQERERTYDPASGTFI